MEKSKKHEYWSKAVAQWQASNQSAIQWCKEQKVVYPTFCYWKKRLLSSPSKDPIIFEELKEQEETSALVLQWRDVSISIPKDVEIFTLERLLVALGRAQC